MKKYLSITFLTCLISVTTCFGQIDSIYVGHGMDVINKQEKQDTVYLPNGILYNEGKSNVYVDTENYYLVPKKDYFIIPKTDSSKYYYKRYLALKHKGVADSENKYYLLLQKLKK